MLHLDDRLIISRGMTRVCYHHPEKSSLIIKTAVNGNQKGEQANVNELHGYQDLIRTHVDLHCISHCFGFVTTNRGKGLVCQAVRDSNGSGAISRSIWDIIVYQEHSDIEYITRVVGQFCEYLRDNDIFLFDLNLKNILLQLQEDGTYVPHAIDLKGRYDLNEAIPFSKYSRFCARKKLERRTRQLIDRIHEFSQIRPELKKTDRLLYKELYE